jgi:hypothetical protein
MVSGAAWAGETEVTEIAVSTGGGKTRAEAEFLAVTIQNSGLFEGGASRLESLRCSAGSPTDLAGISMLPNRGSC